MKKFLIFIMFSLLIIPVSLFASGSSPKCNTKYPIILSHGMGASGMIKVFGVNVVSYWYGIEGALEDEGANVFITSVNGMDSTANKAAAWKTQVLQIMAITGASKVNVIAHSHGGLYTRYAISNLGMYSKVASLTTMCTPHRGSAVADVILGLAGDSGWLIGAALDSIYSIMFGDNNPQSLQNGIEVTRPYCNNIFNPNTLNKTGVYYQSWATKINVSSQSVILGPTWLLLLAKEGANDGLVSTTSAVWGNFRGIQSGGFPYIGIDHLNAVNQLFGIVSGLDVPNWYVGIVSDLKSRGY
jgi:triacylglycerol lipase